MERRYAKRVRERWDDALSRISWDDFEQRVGDYYARAGYDVKHVGTGSGFAQTDGGIDLKLYKDDQYIVVQCKHWNALQVTHNPVHELIGVMHTEGATGAILVTSGEFTRAALASAAKYPRITLIDGVKVRDLIGPIETPPMLLDIVSLPSWTRTARRPFRERSDAWMYVCAGALVLASVLIYKVMHQSLSSPTPVSNVYPSAQPRMQQPVIRRTESATPMWHGRPLTRYASAPVSYPDGRAAAQGDVPASGIDIKAWERKNAESMKILEKTTPEWQTP